MIAQSLQEGALERLLLTTDHLPPEEWLDLAEQYKTNLVWVGTLRSFADRLPMLRHHPLPEVRHGIATMLVPSR